LRIGDRLSPIVRVQSALREGCLSAEECKSFIQVASNWVTVSAGLVGIVSAILALRTYTTNSKRERAKLAVQLFEKFYEGERYKKVREALDCLTDEPGVPSCRREAAFQVGCVDFVRLLPSLHEAP
jgi:hypothetical protein